MAKDDRDRNRTGLSCVIAGLDPAIPPSFHHRPLSLRHPRPRIRGDKLQRGSSTFFLRFFLASQEWSSAGVIIGPRYARTRWRRTTQIRDGTGLSCVIAGLDPAIHDESQQGHKCLTSGIASWMPGSRPGRIYHQADIASCIANVHFCTQSRHGRAALGFISHGKFENAT